MTKFQLSRSLGSRAQKSTKISQKKGSGIAIYTIGNWYDIYWVVPCEIRRPARGIRICMTKGGGETLKPSYGRN